MNYVGREVHLAKLDFLATFCYVFENEQWEIIPLLQTPVSVNWTIDDSQDSANISFLSTTRLERIPNGSYITLVYDNNGTPTYNDYKPNNHDVFIIKRGECRVKKGLAYHSYTLVELIEITKDITLETLTFSSDTQVSVRYDSGAEKTYYKPRLDALQIIERILRHQKTAFIGKTQLDIVYENIDFIIKEKTWLGNELLGVDDAFTENTLYDALVKIGGYLDRYPVIYFNKDYDGTNEMYILEFEKRVNLNPNITLSSVKVGAIEMLESDDSSLAKKIVSNVKNLIGSRPIYYPAENMFAPAVNQDENEIQITKTSKLKLVFDNPISDVVEIIQLLYTVDMVDEQVTGRSSVYKTIQCYKHQDWLVQYDRDDKAYFKENTNEIIFGDNIVNEEQGITTFTSEGVTTTIYKYYYYQAKAYTNIGLQMIKGDGQLSQFYNQTDSLIDSSSYGRQLENYTKANSGGDLTISKIVDNYADILQVGQRVDDYIVSKISFNTFKADGSTKYKVAYVLNKDFVRRNQFILADNRIRNSQTYYENVYDRYINFRERINLSIRWGELTNNLLINQFKLIQDKNVVMGGLLSKVDESPLEMPKQAMIQTTTSTFTNSSYTTSENIVKWFMLNTNKTQVDRSVLINIKTLDNVSLGKKVTSPNAAGVQVQTPTIYTNPFGEVGSIEVILIKPADIVLLNDNYPILSEVIYMVLRNNNTMVRMMNADIEKDAREKMNITFQFDYRGYGDTLIGDEFIKYSGLLGEREFSVSGGIIEPIFYVVGETKGMYDIGDIVSPIAEWVEIGGSTYNQTVAIVNETLDCPSETQRLGALPSLSSVDDDWIVRVQSYFSGGGGPELCDTSYYQKQTNAKVVKTITSTSHSVVMGFANELTYYSSRDYFIARKIGNDYKLMAKISQTGATSSQYISICY